MLLHSFYTYKLYYIRFVRFRTSAARFSTTPLNNAPKEAQQISKDLALLSPEEKEQKRKLQNYITLEEPVRIRTVSCFACCPHNPAFLGGRVARKPRPAGTAEEPARAHLRARQERHAERNRQHAPLGDGVRQPAALGEPANGLVLNVSIWSLFYSFINVICYNNNQ